MPLLTFLISLVARKANDIVQAVFGWSVTALFGRLRRRAQVLVTGALVLAIAWPLFVIGVIAPNVASWVIAFVPLHHWIGETALRILWTVLAVGAPLIVGMLVHLAAPRDRAHLAAAVIRGYPIALGFALAFLAVVITVPIIKIASLWRRWSDEHVYVEPHDGAYDAVLECLVVACRRAGLEPVVSDAPRAMVLATTIMRTLARGAIDPFVATRLRRITAPGLELYLYPGDLLMRGAPFVVARVRAMLSRTELDAKAYLVDGDAAKAIQDGLGAIAKTPHPSAATVQRLQAVYRQLLHADISFESWSVLENIARRLERQLLNAHLVDPDALPLDATGDDLPRDAPALRATDGRGTAPRAQPAS